MRVALFRRFVAALDPSPRQQRPEQEHARQSRRQSPPGFQRQRVDVGDCRIGIVFVGIDSVNIDDTRTGERPIHTALLGAGIPIVEHLCALGRVVGRPFTFTAAPPAVVGMGTFPVRAVATLG